MLANSHWNNPLLGSTSSWWRMQAAEALTQPSWLKIIRIKDPIKERNLSAYRVRIKILLPAQLKTSIYSGESLAIYMAFLEFTQVLWEASKPTIVLTDNKSVLRFLQTKTFPSPLWIECNYVLQFNFKIAHITGSANTAAYFPSRLELKVTEKIRLEIREDVQTIHIEVTISSSEVAVEEQSFFTQADGEDESEEHILQAK